MPTIRAITSPQTDQECKMPKMKRIGLILALCLVSLQAFAQGNNMTPAPAYSGAPVNRSTVNGSVIITTGNTFQQVLASNFNTTTQRQALTIANNNATDSCWIYFGSGTPTKGTSILLLAGGSYSRYWPFVPSDIIQATCASNSDTLYVDTQ